MNNFRFKPIYLDFPILQITYVLFWFPLGYFFSLIISTLIVKTAELIMIFLLRMFFPVSIQYYLFSGRMSNIIEPFYGTALITYDILILIIGLELISRFIEIQKVKYE